MGWLYSDEWAAGFFDGEGCVSISVDRSKQTPQHDLTVSVSQKHCRPLDELQIQHGGSISPTKTPSGCWRWRLAGGKAERFLRRIYPHSLEKHSQITLALAFRGTIGTVGHRIGSDVTAHREAIRLRMREAKK
jgi:hypothetical protein